MMPVTERTPLRGDNVPPYVFLTSHNRSYKNKIRRFQCCLCAGLLAVFITALVITVSYSLNHDTEDNNSTALNTSSLQRLLTLSWPLKDREYGKWEGPAPSPAEVDAAVAAGQEGLKARESYETVLPAMQKDSPSYRHQLTTKTSPQAREMARSGYIIDLASRELGKKAKSKGGKGPKVAPQLLPDDACKEDTTRQCPPSKYRTVDGTCNNQNHPSSWGVALRPFRRILPPDYADGVSAPRRATDGTALPSARQVSLTIHRPIYRDDPKFTVMLAVWGQFIDHDITATALSQGTGGSAITCCFTYLRSAMKQHPECYTVNLGKQDPFYEEYNVTCMEFVRSAPSPVCNFGPREQMNQASSFLDGSSVYGTSDGVMASLRLFQGGLLKMLMTSTGRELLPVSTDLNDGCNRVEEFQNGRYCFLSGDPRSNENIHLTSIHLLFARQHNFLARKLAELNPQWEDERIFQESRKIVAAQIQHITYSEFLPVVLGPVSTVVAQSKDYFNGYNGDVDASIANGFAASAFRFGHSLLPGLMKVIANDSSSEEYVELHSMLFNPFGLYDHEYLERVVEGASNTHAQRVDTYFNKEVTEHLFERKPSVGKPKGPCGLDLVSLNVQRGRDHGLPGYPEWREHCGLSKPKTFDDLADEVDQEALESMKTLYKSVDDIDMYTGALAELPVEGGIIGPTLTCLLTDQFLRLKIGDRFWYETPEQPQAFTPGQLDQIRKTSLARVICDTSGVVHSQPWVMRVVGEGNVRGPCSDLTDLDYTAWKEDVEPLLPTGPLAAPSVAVQTIGGAKEPPVWVRKFVRIGGYVTGGRASVGGTPVWDGQVPAAIPFHPFDAVVSPDEASDAYPTTYAHGIAWKGSVTAEGGAGKLQGRFSLPQYIHTTNHSKFNIQWYNGEFELDFRVLWNSTNQDTLSIDGEYSSAVHFNVRKEFAGLRNASVPPAKDLSGISGSGDPLVVSAEYTTPLVLLGAVSNENQFIWSGNFTLVVPVPPPEPQVGLLKMAYTPSTYVKRVRVGATVVGGTINAQGTRVWNGGVPVVIPIQPFDAVAEEDATDSPTPVVYGHGILWRGSLSATSADSATMTGRFSLPRYIHSNGITNFSIEWYNGDFNFNLKLLWNSTGEQQINMDGFFTSPVYFAQRAQYDTLRDRAPIASFKDLNLGFSFTPSQLAPGEEQGPKSPIILLGTYSVDRTFFYWSGDVSLTIPKVVNLLGASPKPKEVQAPSPKKPRLPLRLLGGQVNVDGWNLWSGILPVAISVDLFDSILPEGGDSAPRKAPKVFGHGILWNGTLETVDADSARLQGTFSFPRFLHGNGAANFTIAWINGNFDLHVQLNDTVQLNGSYSTSVIFAERKEYENLRDLAASAPHSLEDLGVSTTDLPLVLRSSSLTKYSSVPLVLLGAYSLDRTQFLWSGNFLLGTTKSSPFVGAPMLADDVTTRVKVGARVVRGKINAQGETAWNGMLPVSFPTNPFDAVATTTDAEGQEPVFAHGILWTGSLSFEASGSALLSGTFSLPMYQHAPFAIRWFNGDFSFYLSVLWNSLNDSSLDVTGRYSSPVYFQSRRQYGYLQTNDTPEVALSLQPSEAPSESPDGVRNGPLILLGTYSKDRTRFLWSGDVTLALPITPRLVGVEEPREVRISAFVAGGSVTCGGDIVWIGNRVPIAMPQRALDGVTSEGTPDSVTIAHGISWKGFIVSDAPGSLKVWGVYSLPRYLHGNDTNQLTVQWYNGEFAFQLKLIGDYEQLNIDGEFVSPLYLDVKQEYQHLQTPLPGTFAPSALTPSSQPTQPPADTPVYAPLVLLGTFSPDKSLFIWSGNVTLILPISPTVT